jgi:hypothetical protein
MEKRKQRDERKEAGRRQKGGYERNAKERASGDIQTQTMMKGIKSILNFIFPETKPKKIDFDWKRSFKWAIQIEKKKKKFNQINKITLLYQQL